MKILIKIVIVAAAMLLAAEIVPGILVANFWPTAVIAAVVFGLLNMIVKPILHILAFPITLVTFGLFTFVINALIFWLLTFLDGFSIEGFIAALLGSLVVSIVSWIANKIF